MNKPTEMIRQKVVEFALPSMSAVLFGILFIFLVHWDTCRYSMKINNTDVLSDQEGLVYLNFSDLDGDQNDEYISWNLDREKKFLMINHQYRRLQCSRS